MNKVLYRSVRSAVPLLLAAVFTPLAQAQEFSCPASLPVQQTASATPAGWEALLDQTPANFDRVAFYLGNPADNASLAPDGKSATKAEERTTWTFKRSAGDHFWLACVYDGSRVFLAQKLKDEVAACTVHYQLLPSGSRLRIKAITCK